MSRTAVVWFRRDLRLHDHPALAAAVSRADVVVPLFVFDDVLLRGRWPAPNRVWFMRESVAELGAALEALGAPLRVLRGRTAEIVPRFALELGADAIHVTRDAAPHGRRRDEEIAARLAPHGIAVEASPGLYVHDPDAVSTAAGRPFTVFSPFRRAWEARDRRPRVGVPDRLPGQSRARPDPVPSLAELGVAGPSADPVLLPAPGEAAARFRLDDWLAGPVDAYHEARNRLDPGATSRLSQDVRFGLLSPLEVVERAGTGRGGEGRRIFTSEVVWREFYAHVLWHQPRVTREPFNRALADLPWRDDPAAFEAWRTGRTGYPVVDAAMRQLQASGFVHNRGRMIAASFLTKDLLLDWRLGEAEFMAHLLDGDVASNNGGWQWTASTGTDPQPWFRVFNPVLQGRRHDPDGGYVRRWVPELRSVPDAYVHEPWRMPPEVQEMAGCRVGVDYPGPIVDHAAARARALAAYTASRTAGR
jgi:deoxyribodipyrimidine photo-lyase